MDVWVFLARNRKIDSEHLQWFDLIHLVVNKQNTCFFENSKS